VHRLPDVHTVFTVMAFHWPTLSCDLLTLDQFDLWPQNSRFGRLLKSYLALHKAISPFTKIPQPPQTISPSTNYLDLHTAISPFTKLSRPSQSYLAFHKAISPSTNYLNLHKAISSSTKLSRPPQTISPTTKLSRPPICLAILKRLWLAGTWEKYVLHHVTSW
jgi:hypothetical protein